MQSEQIQQIMESARSLYSTLSVPVMLDHSEVLKLIVADLLAKQRFNVERGREEWAEAFKTVLSYYLSPEELAALIPASKDLKQQKLPLTTCTLSLVELLAWADEECEKIVSETWPMADSGDYDSTYCVYIHHINEKDARCVGSGKTIESALRAAWIEEHYPANYGDFSSADDTSSASD